MVRGRRASPRPRTVRATAASSDFAVTFWGVRGSLPSPGVRTQRYGGNTACVEVRCGEEQLVFDLGSGARGLGEATREATSAVRATLFLTHYHHDHLLGLPFFAPLFKPGNAFRLYGPTRNGQSVREILAGHMVPPYFPVTPDMVFHAQVEYLPAVAGETLEIGEARVHALELNHPGGTLGYRVDFRGRSVVYATDCEHGTDADARLVEFARGTDLLIYDAMYTQEEYAGQVGAPKAGWGHSTWQAAVKVAREAQVKKLALFHHDPLRDDVTLERMVRQARRFWPATLAAREALVVRL